MFFKRKKTTPATPVESTPSPQTLGDWRAPEPTCNSFDQANEWLIGEMWPEFRAELEMLKSVCPDMLRLRASMTHTRDHIATAMAMATGERKSQLQKSVHAMTRWLELTAGMSGRVFANLEGVEINPQFTSMEAKLRAAHGDRDRWNATLNELIADLETKAAEADAAERLRLLDAIQQLRMQIHH